MTSPDDPGRSWPAGLTSTRDAIRYLSTGELARRYRDMLGQYDRAVMHDDEEADQRLAEVSDSLIETARLLIERLLAGVAP